jgi:hypothetical protein
MRRTIVPAALLAGVLAFQTGQRLAPAQGPDGMRRAEPPPVSLPAPAPAESRAPGARPYTLTLCGLRPCGCLHPERQTYAYVFRRAVTGLAWSPAELMSGYASSVPTLARTSGCTRPPKGAKTS